ncbi:MAG: glycosyl hydrolase family 18 protein [Clostridium sp.]
MHPKDRKILKVIAIILAFILLSSGAIIAKDKLFSKNTSSQEEITKDDTQEENSQTENTATSSYNAWDATATYNKGDKVVLNGKVYEAKWWTKGDAPDKTGDFGAWQLIGDDTNKEPADKKPEESIQDNSPSIAGQDFRVVGYFPEWKPDKENTIQYNKLTHINYSFAIPEKDGTIKPLDNPDLAKRIIKNAHKNNVKVLIAVGGWEYKGTPLEMAFVEATNTEEKCKKLADSILKMVDDYGFDGVDMDWEHPRTDGVSKTQYASLLKHLRKGLTERKKLLTSAVLAGVNAEGNVLWDAAGHTDEALACVDWINVMAYDGGDGDRHSSYDFALASANYWLKNRKLPKNKVVLGVPFYGRPSWATYEEILKADPNAYKKDKAMIDGKEAHYNGIDTIKKKTKWAKDNCAGVMIWEITQDSTDKDKSLLNAIYETVK